MPTKGLTAQHKGLAVPTKGSAIQQKGLAALTKGLAVEYKMLAVQHKRLAVRYKGFADQHKGLADQHESWTLQHEGLAVQQEGLTVWHDGVGGREGMFDAGSCMCAEERRSSCRCHSCAGRPGWSATAWGPVRSVRRTPISSRRDPYDEPIDLRASVSVFFRRAFGAGLSGRAADAGICMPATDAGTVHSDPERVHLPAAEHRGDNGKANPMAFDGRGWANIQIRHRFEGAPLTRVSYMLGGCGYNATWNRHLPLDRDALLFLQKDEVIYGIVLEPGDGETSIQQAERLIEEARSTPYPSPAR